MGELLSGMDELLSGMGELLSGMDELFIVTINESKLTAFLQKLAWGNAKMKGK